MSWRMYLRWLYDNLSGPRVNELLQLAIVFLNFSLEKEAYEEDKNGSNFIKNTRINTIMKGGIEE